MKYKKSLATVYLFYIFTVYPMLLTNKYFRMTKDHFLTFFIGSCVYLYVLLMCKVIENVLAKGKKHENMSDDIAEKAGFKLWQNPGIYMISFMLANIIACMVSLDSNESFFGAGSRYMGMATFLAMILVAYSLMNSGAVKVGVFIVFEAMAMLSLGIAFLQYLGVNPFGLRTGISTLKQAYKFMSFFGNMNIYAAFVIMAMGINIGLYVFSNKELVERFVGLAAESGDKSKAKHKEKNKDDVNSANADIWLKGIRIVSAIILVAAGINFNVANSDSVYLAFVGMMFAFFLITIKDGAMERLFKAGAFVTFGNLITAIICYKAEWSLQTIREMMQKAIELKKNDRFFKLYEMETPFHLNKWDFGGIPAITVKLPVALGLFAVFVLLVVIVKFLKKYFGVRFSEISAKARTRIVSAIAVASVVGGIVVIIIGNKMKISYFVFDDDWGTDRGYIYRLASQSFEEAPLINKVFGYGNETVREVINRQKAKEASTKNKKSYDNVHCEPLQYLVTTGILGMVSFLGLFASSIYVMLKQRRRSILTYMMFGAVVGYFIQCLISINQPLTTPFYYVFLGIGLGAALEENQ